MLKVENRLWYTCQVGYWIFYNHPEYTHANVDLDLLAMLKPHATATDWQIVYRVDEDDNVRLADEGIVRVKYPSMQELTIQARVVVTAPPTVRSDRRKPHSQNSILPEKARRVVLTVTHNIASSPIFRSEMEAEGINDPMIWVPAHTGNTAPIAESQYRQISALFEKHQVRENPFPEDHRLTRKVYVSLWSK